MTFDDVVKQWLIPGNLSLFFAGLTLGIVMMGFPRIRRMGFAILLVVVVSYGVMSMPMGAWLISRLVSSGYSSNVDRAALMDVQAIVVLDASTDRYQADDVEIVVVSRQSATRALEAIRIHRLISPKLIIVSGGAAQMAGAVPEGAALRDLLISSGIPAHQVLLDSASRNTREHARNVSRILHERRVNHIALVTSAVHMRRALQAFAGSHLTIVPVPAPVPMPSLSDWRPRVMALERSSEAWYEVLALGRDLLR